MKNLKIEEVKILSKSTQKHIKAGRRPSSVVCDARCWDPKFWYCRCP